MTTTALAPMRTVHSLRAALSGSRRWLRAFRRTRPFWGALWLGLGGYWIIHFSLGSFHIVVSSGFSAISGWIVGGGMLLCALIGLMAPSQKLTVGAIGLVLSIVSLIASNIGGFLVGMTLGVVGATMMLAWGPKKAAGRRKLTAARG